MTAPAHESDCQRKRGDEGDIKPMKLVKLLRQKEDTGFGG